MIIGRDEIIRLAKGDSRLICPFSLENVRRSSYDLTVGEEYYVGGSGPNGVMSAESVAMGHSFKIPAHGLCFVLSAEAISLPYDLTAKVSLRMSHVYEGLVLTAQPPFDPGYRGRVIIMIHNLSSGERHIKRGDRVATMEFSRVIGLALDSDGEAPGKAHRSVSGIAQQLRQPVQSGLNDLSDRASSLGKEIATLKTLGLAFAALLLAVVAIPAANIYSALDQKIDELKKRLDSVESVQKHQKLGDE
ncbi:deoxycytidine triphosphate deaminase [Stenotrophomonas sp. AN71]|uniref:dCTP deaminase domain-containing protein n=1 Tax=Stenotrophomonas sp. AN71 TaxID=3156253 RepID=UPI003D24CEB7